LAADSISAIEEKTSWFCCVMALVLLLLRYWLGGAGLNIYALTFIPLALGALSALAFRTIVWRELFEPYASKLSWVTFAAFLVFVLAEPFGTC